MLELRPFTLKCSGRVPSRSGALVASFHAPVLCLQRMAVGEEYQEKLEAFVEELKGMPIAIETDAANEQHYEVRPIMAYANNYETVFTKYIQFHDII